MPMHVRDESFTIRSRGATRRSNAAGYIKWPLGNRISSG